MSKSETTSPSVSVSGYFAMLLALSTDNDDSGSCMHLGKPGEHRLHDIEHGLALEQGIVVA